MNQSTIDILVKNGLTIQGKCIASSQVHTLFCPKKTDNAFNTLTKDKNMLTLDALKRVLKAIRNKKTLALLEKLNNVKVSVVSSDEKTDLGIIKRYDDGSTKICINGHDIDIMLVNNRVWTRADQFCKALGYTDEVRRIMNDVCIDNIHRPCIGILQHMFIPTNAVGYKPTPNVDFEALSQDEQQMREYLFGNYKALDLDPNRFCNELKPSYLSRYAILKLILKCTKSPAMKLKLEDDMTKVYSIVCDTGSFENNEHHSIINSAVTSQPASFDSIDDSEHREFDNEELIKLKSSEVCYLLDLGIMNGQRLIKFGCTKHILKRLDEHRAMYTDCLRVLNVFPTNNRSISNLFEDEMKEHFSGLGTYFTGTLTKTSSEDKLNPKEIIISTKRFDIDYIVNQLPSAYNHAKTTHELTSTDKTQSQVELDHEYRMTQESTKLSLEKEKTKQLELEIRKLELQCKLAGITSGEVTC